ncbi:lipopolysaccharide biosynthesis protein [Hymenobacter canadensis]|uniref:Lipopolysaccharide biosynthesis protein n=1 Tax=Hymenobacter canadensis TaxID=2999067 RepID=A0ABY7LWG3_9BACT|nr:lipopolysaccharide biosynthesis protein [Hymenobacter canadensis]WBA43080.1 lipopolysaccharide biosynthesis protein [Hymenobacter canadensis]
MHFRQLAPNLRNNQFLSLAGNVAASGLTVVSVSLLFRGLPTAAIGAWVFFLSMLGLGEAFRQGCLTTGFIRAYAGADAPRRAEVLGSAWALGLLITVALSSLGLLAQAVPALAASPSLGLFLRWFPLLFLLTLPAFMATCLQQAEEHFARLLRLRLLMQGAFIVGITGLLLLHQLTLLRVVYCYLGAAGLTSALTLLLGWSFPSALRHRSAATMRELGHFGKYSVGSYIGAYLLRSSDTVLINFLLGPAALAVYNLAQRFMEIIEIPLRSLMATAMPRLAAAVNQQNRPLLAHLFEQNAGLLTWLLLPVVIGTVLLAEVPVYLVGGSHYVNTEAANVLRIAVSMALLYPIDRFTGVALDVLGNPRLNLYKVLLMLAVNVAGDWVGIHFTHSIYGVALASLPTILTGFLFGYLLLKRSLPITIAGTLRVGLAEVRALLRRFGPAAPVSVRA